MSKNQRKLARNHVENRHEIPSQLKQLIQEAQSCLKSGSYEKAIECAGKIEMQLLNDPDNSSIYLTSILWQIRALQSLNRVSEFECRIDEYLRQAEYKQSYPHQIQAYRLKAQRQIESACWHDAMESLTQALQLAIESTDGKNTFELLMHLSAIEVKIGLYCDGMEHLARGLSVVENSGLPADEIHELKAIGQRQLCELFDKTGDGKAACNALDAAMSVHCSDIEEHWLQQILLSHFDLRIGNANEAFRKLDNVRSDIVRKNSDKYKSQLDAVELDISQVLRSLGKYQQAEDRISNIQTSSVAIQKAVALTKFQWAIDNGKNKCDPDEALKRFIEIEMPDEAGDRPVIWAGEISVAALDVMRGNLETAFESLQHISEKSTFAELIPISTKARLLMAEIEFKQKKFESAACHAHEITENFIQHVDDVSARLSAILMLRSQYEVSLIQSGGDTVNLDKAENASLMQLCADCERYRNNGHIEAFLDLGIQLAMFLHRMGDTQKCTEFIAKMDKYIQPEFMACRAIQYYQLKYTLNGEHCWLDKADDLIQRSGFVL